MFNLTLLITLWLGIVAVIGFVRPRHVPVMLLYGLVVMLAVRLTSGLFKDRLIPGSISLAFGALICFIPLSNTWVPRIWRDLVLDLSANPLYVILLPEVLGVILLVGLQLVKNLQGKAETLTRVLRIGGFLMLAGALVSTLGALTPVRAAGAVILGVVVPCALFLLSRTIATTPRVMLWILLMLTLGSSVPLILGIVSAVEIFGIPLNTAALLKLKMNLNFTGNFGEATFGNSGHMVSFVVLVGPVLAVLATSRMVPNGHRVFSAGVMLLALINLFLTFSRVAILVTMCWLIALTVKRLRETGKVSRLLSAMILVMGVVLSSPISMIYYGKGFADAEQSLLATTIIEGPKFFKLGAAISDTGYMQAHELGITDSSGQIRLRALSTGVKLAIQHGWFGAGYAAYPQLDPIDTAPHSLLLQTWVEGGILSAIGLFLIFGYASWRSLGLLLTKERKPMYDLSLAGALASSVFLAYGFVNGSVLALDGMGVCGAILGVLLAFASGNKSLERVTC